MMKRGVNRKLKRASATVEMAIVTPILLTLVFGIIEYGWVFTVRQAMTNAAREGARVGVTRDAASAPTAAVDAANAYLTSSGVSGASVQATTPSDADPGVTVTITLDPFKPIVGFVPTPDRLSASATMRWELAKVNP